MTNQVRRTLLRAAAAAPMAGAFGFPAIVRAASAPEFVFKYGNNLPLTHPLNIRAQEAANQVKDASKGRMEIRIFPNNQLGGDTDMLAQVRSGGIEMFTPSSLVVSTLAPAVAINAVGFAFSDYDQVWKAMDGSLGTFARDAMRKAGLESFEKMWDNGFRQTTTSSGPIANAQSMKGLKIRVPVSPLSIDMFKGLGAAPTSLQFSEVYSSLQTHIVDAQENPLPIVQVAKLYEVQKYCSLTNHIWDGYWFVLNPRAWQRLPKDLQGIASDAFNQAAVKQREDVAKLNGAAVADLKSKGLAINQPAPDTFRTALRQAGFYAQWKGRFGNQAWDLLEQTVGKLA
ncbi:TRAP transporter substrate-binding protein [Paraburkholderia unamae]|uniref:Tripartite ATP-independent transporter DctP family solute receptor n=1 Tax=Paraburkholderia unamae TaxID=219649 RepID=A0ABX5KLL6_9BURK|nr:TRAP transporter substrate-binding protein [Paraburkholderia unamae]PVX82908.1 tripartite ATP-independent transporter DctP family solute receptor [Paraburkholderia unamae]RAR61156.1 tripartite ATP-independent transporter DctP family solute receptor [Paraburkholderia unamae]